MKNKILAVLLAVCMITGTCVLFASGAGATQTTYGKSGEAFLEDVGDLNGKTYEEVRNLDRAPSGVGVNYTFKLRSTHPTISPSVTKIDNSNIRDYYNITPSLDDNVVKVEGYLGPNDTTIKINLSVRNTADYYNSYVYVLKNTLSDSVNNSSTGDSDKYNNDSLKPVTSSDYEKVAAYRFTLNKTDGSTTTVDFSGVLTLENVDRSETLQSLTMGLRFYGNTYDNISAAEIAHIKATYKQNYGDNGSQTKDIVTYMNKISDLKEGTKVSLTAELKKPAVYGDDYGFKCWVDSNGKVISENSTIIWTAGSSPSSLYAVFVELKGRVRINYSWEGEGAVAYQETTSDFVFKREVLSDTVTPYKRAKDNVSVSEGQLSVLEGHEITFVFTPKEGYEVAHVYVDRTGTGAKTDVASFKSIVLNDGLGPSLQALKELISATGANRSFTIEEDKHRQEDIYYKFTFTGTDTTGREDLIRSIHVEFKLKEVYKAPEGMDLPTVAPGVSLEASPENAEGANGDTATTLPPEGGAAANGSTPLSGTVVNPATGSASSTGSIAVFTVLSLAAGAALVTAKKRKKEN